MVSTYDAEAQDEQTKCNISQLQQWIIFYVSWGMLQRLSCGGRFN